MKNATNPADGDYVVVQNNQRVTATTPSQAEALAEAERRNKLLEASGQPPTATGPATVKQNLCG